MSSTEIPNRLLDRIYDAASDGADWPRAMQQVAEFTGGLGGILFGLAPDGRALFEYNGGLDDRCSAVYRERHARDNPWSNVMLKEPAGKLVLSDEIIRLKDLRLTSFYDEVLKPQGIGYNAMACGSKSRQLVIAVNICRSERSGGFDARQRSMQQRLLPHLQRALLLERRLAGYRELQAINCQALDRLTSGLLLIDASGGVVFANRAAEALAKIGYFVLAKDHLQAKSGEEQKELMAALEAVGRGEPSRAVRLRAPGTQAYIIATAVSVRGRDLDRFVAYGPRAARAMIFLSDPSKILSPARARLIDFYGLTSAEARVAVAAAKGQRLRSLSHQLGLSTNTVKTHLRRIYEKTGVIGHAELVRLLACLAVITF